ncbi:hypothetical protein J2Y37_001742 [Prolinoborus sp. 3657]|nr:hypothetical protein [Prolinoborus sp. 3657]
MVKKFTGFNTDVHQPSNYFKVMLSLGQNTWLQDIV